MLAAAREAVRTALTLLVVHMVGASPLVVGLAVHPPHPPMLVARVTQAAVAVQLAQQARATVRMHGLALEGLQGAHRTARRGRAVRKM